MPTSSSDLTPSQLTNWPLCLFNYSQRPGGYLRHTSSLAGGGWGQWGGVGGRWGWWQIREEDTPHQLISPHWLFLKQQQSRHNVLKLKPPHWATLNPDFQQSLDVLKCYLFHHQITKITQFYLWVILDDLARINNNVYLNLLKMIYLYYFRFIGKTAFGATILIYDLDFCFVFVFCGKIKNQIYNN